MNVELLVVSALLLVLSGAVLQAVLDIDLAALARVRPRRAAGARG
jgi:hypothetical protein